MKILKFGGESLVHAQHFFSIQEVLKQNLETPIREGYTVVEWGGTEIK